MWCLMIEILLVLVGVLVKFSNENSRSEAPEKISNEQNMILHSTLEEHGLAGNSSRNVDEDAGLQNVVEYLRRTKEIAETGFSLLEQVKFRLQAQVTEINLLRKSNAQLGEEKKLYFDECQKLGETSQKARTEIENLETDVTALKRRVDEAETEISLLKDGKNELQAQVTEINLLRKSNAQLGEEKKLYFDECQKLGETSQKARTEIENLETDVTALKRRVDEAETEISLLKDGKNELQAQVTEINLLRKSNAQLGEEKKLYFDECQKLGETSQKARTEIENLETDVTALKRRVDEAETEISLLKDGKNELQAQLDIAKTAETSQASLRAERDEEFKSLQLQLRKSNDQLGEEKKNYFDECQKLLETSQKARTKIEKLETMLAVKEKDVTDLKKEKEKLKMEKEHIERRVDEIFEVTEVSGAYADAYIYQNKDKVIVMEIKDDSTSSVATHKILRKASVQLVDQTVVYSVRASEINRLSPQYRKGIGVMVKCKQVVGWIDAQTVAGTMTAKTLATAINNLALS